VRDEDETEPSSSSSSSSSSCSTPCSSRVCSSSSGTGSSSAGKQSIARRPVHLTQSMLKFPEYHFAFADTDLGAFKKGAKQKSKKPAQDAHKQKPLFGPSVQKDGACSSEEVNAKLDVGVSVVTGPPLSFPISAVASEYYLTRAKSSSGQVLFKRRFVLVSHKNHGHNPAYVKEDGAALLCVCCGKTWAYDTSNTNLNGHFKTKHPLVWKELHPCPPQPTILKAQSELESYQRRREGRE
jgi:hypothetical protein